MALQAVSLDDKYTRDSGRVFLTGTQALVRLPMMQRQRDLAAGLNTAAFVTGYRGSPLGGVDQQMARARQFLQKHHIEFQAGVNEDLAATAVWGTQQLDLFGDSNYDGVFSMWYGKGPGVDRSGDVLRHGNMAGSARHGGVLLLAGDDHTAKSSTTAHQSELTFQDLMIPVLNPAGVQEFLDLGLYGWAMSRYSGCWVGFKTIAETVDSTASVSVDRWDGLWAGAEPRLVLHPTEWLNLTVGAETRQHFSASLTTFEYADLADERLASQEPINSESPTFAVTFWPR